MCMYVIVGFWVQSLPMSPVNKMAVIDNHSCTAMTGNGDNSDSGHFLIDSNCNTFNGRGFCLKSNHHSVILFNGASDCTVTDRGLANFLVSSDLACSL